MSDLAQKIRSRAPFIETPADRDALDLLLSFLTPLQQSTLATYGYIEIICPLGIYRIFCGHLVENIVQMHQVTRKPLLRWCIGPQFGYFVATWDLFLIQLITLKAHPAIFLDVAHSSAFMPFSNYRPGAWGHI